MRGTWAWWLGVAAVLAGAPACVRAEASAGRYGALLVGLDGDRVSGAAAPEGAGCRVRFAGHRGDGGWILTAWVDGDLGPGVGAFLDLAEGPAPSARLRLAEDLPGCPARRVGARRHPLAVAAPWREVATTAAASAALPAGEVVAVVERRGGRALVTAPGGGTGWIAAAALISAAPPLAAAPDPTAAAVARIAGVWVAPDGGRFEAGWRGWSFGGAACRAPAWRRAEGGVAAGCRAPPMAVTVAEEGGDAVRVFWLGRSLVLAREGGEAAAPWP